MPSSRNVGERTLEELVKAGEVKSALILKGEFTREEVELIRRGYEEGIKVYLAENERLREALKSIADASVSDTTFETARRIARTALAANSEAGNSK